MKNRAFTLVEMLVTVSIIAILILLGFPAYNYVHTYALSVTAVNNLRQLTLANMDYAADHGHYVPMANASDNWYWCGKKTGSEYNPTKGLLSPYLGNDQRVIADPLFTALLSRQKSQKGFAMGCGGYGYNTYIGGNGNWSWSDEYNDWMSTPLTLGQMERLSQTVMFGTTALANSNGVQEYPVLVPPYWPDDEGNPSTFMGRPTPSLHFRFNNSALVSWCDGHVTYEKMEKRTAGYNPYGGDAAKNKLGWFGSDDNNGYWNPFRPSP